MPFTGTRSTFKCKKDPSLLQETCNFKITWQTWSTQSADLKVKHGQSGVRIPTQWHRSSTWLTLTTFKLLNGNTEFYAYITSMTCHQVRNFLIFDQNIVLCSITLQISKCINRARLLISVQGCMSPPPQAPQTLDNYFSTGIFWIINLFSTAFFISRRYLLWYFSHDKIKKLLFKRSDHWSAFRNVHWANILLRLEQQY